MNTEFDPTKDQSNREKHGLSLALAEAFEFETALIEIDDRRDYAEERFVALGLIDTRVHVMVFTVRGEAIRVISLRKANRREVKRYDDET
ncbi:BrnT family toxin [Pandoraea nosoerga]|uniref:BrnT family toxin n=1 Tax=Pandoraea nosoerga TaxID=2508296 RepID=UPI00197E8140|nr:BrnT family toxin [Pandoraea nosoerga]MBN4667222.1 BrnT family toxin [Pandoraea nosoerga]MBN4677209.1 BrnT family toxin [Pandoraea nosoerga]MBN4681969.1 BrnT family toxin [Pandoraea nosoerga]MBN4746287.1 BrnT family toxin [Pandoraea nosoerga]